MVFFLKENKEILENLAEKHIEKINWHIKKNSFYLIFLPMIKNSSLN